MRWVVLALAVVVASTAAAAPRMRPFLPMPGISIGGSAATGAFCDSSRRAIFRLDIGTIVAVDAAGTVKTLGDAGRQPFNSLMVCDRKDRIWIAAGRKLLSLRDGTVKTETLPADARALRVLDDGSLGLVDVTGAVFRYTTKLDKQWTAKGPINAPAELDGKADQILSLSGGSVEILEATGRRAGPPAITATWLDDKTILLGDRQGKLSRWTTTGALDNLQKLAELATPRPNSFVRALYTHAGPRGLVVQRGDGPVLALAFEPDFSSAKSTLISRVPSGRRIVASGAATFAVIAIGNRAFVVDLTRTSFATAHDTPVGIVDSMAFSPDGRWLAMTSSDRDIVVTSLDRSSTRRLTTTSLLRGPLRWAADGTLFLTAPNGVLRFNLDGTIDERKERTLGATPSGGAITMDRNLRVAIERGHGEQTFAIADRTFGAFKAELARERLLLRGSQRLEVFDLTKPFDDPPLIRTTKRTFLRDAALVGSAGVVYVDDTGTLYLADGKTERQLDRFVGAPILAVNADNQRIAIANKQQLVIYDVTGRQVASLATTAEIQSLAWSPDLRTLAVATRDGIELWTIPRQSTAH